MYGMYDIHIICEYTKQSLNLDFVDPDLSQKI